MSGTRVATSPPTRGRASEGGFTLVELVVAIAILGIVIGAVATAFIVSARSTESTTRRFEESHDAQIASAYFANDVQSAVSVTAGTCGSTGSYTSLANFKYDLNNASIASYFYDAASPARIIRRFCDAGGNVASEVVLVHHAGSGHCVRYDGGACTTPGSAPPNPRKVKLEINEDPGPAGSYSYALTGSRRPLLLSGGPITNVGEYPSFLVLDAGSASISGNGNLDITGGLTANLGATFGESGNGALEYDAVEVVAPAVCGSLPNCTQRQSTLPDPFAGLAVPNDSDYSVRTGGTFTGTVALNPGVYRTHVTLSNGDFTLNPGIYIFEAGVTIEGPTTVTGTGVMLFVGCGLNNVGCVDGAASLSISNKEDITLTPASSGPYKDLVIWQPVVNGSSMTIDGQSDTTALGGVIYVPNGHLTLGAGQGSFTLGAVIAKTVTVSGQGTIDVVGV